MKISYDKTAQARSVQSTKPGDVFACEGKLYLRLQVELPRLRCVCLEDNTVQSLDTEKLVHVYHEATLNLRGEV